ncbi:MAG: hypothetical protein LBE76_06820 [Nitrososphaerota archaeon]|jgi:hypothetical protein|nr:hypothetical protein [Nitrososphaerota archaeon]
MPIKKIRSGPLPKKGVRTLFLNKGYHPNPVYQWDDENAIMTFEKPLPDGSRLHVRVYEHRDYFEIKEHIDKYDPNRTLEHVFEWFVEIPDIISYIQKRKRKRKTKRQVKKNHAKKR